jgi:hypothetical protein
MQESFPASMGFKRLFVLITGPAYAIKKRQHGSQTGLIRCLYWLPEGSWQSRACFPYAHLWIPALMLGIVQSEAGDCARLCKELKIFRSSWECTR